MNLDVRGPWVFLAQGRHGGDRLVYDLDTERLLTLWAAWEDTLERFTATFAGVHRNIATVTRLGIEERSTHWLAGPAAGIDIYQLHYLHRPGKPALAVPIALQIVADLARGYAALGPDLPGRVDPALDLVGWDGVARVTPTRSAPRRGALVAKDNFLSTSPEALNGASWSEARGAWTLGSVAYYLLTGELPAPGDSEYARLRSLQVDPQPSVGAKRSLDPELVELVDRCRLTRPDERPALKTLGDRFEALGASGHDAVASTLEQLFVDVRTPILETQELLRAAPPEPNERMVVVPARFQRVD